MFFETHSMTNIVGDLRLLSLQRNRISKKQAKGKVVNMDCSRKVTKMKLKRCEKSQNSNASALSKISCKIGDHLVHAYINSGSSISIASTDLYKKLVADKCTFRDGTATLNLIDESIPNQEYRVTTTTVKVIGKSQSINLVTFPDVFNNRTILGMDFLRTKKSNTTLQDDVVFRVPENPAPKALPIHPVEVNDEDQPLALLDWILDTSNLKKPLYNILADGTADDEDLFAICAFMKRMPRMVSPIRDFDELSSCTDSELDVVSFNRIERAAIASDRLTLNKPSITSNASTSPAKLLDKGKPELSSSRNHDMTPLKTSMPSKIPLDEPREMDMSSTEQNQASILRTLLLTTSSDKADLPSKNETTVSNSPAQSTISMDEKVISSSLKNPVNASLVSVVSSLENREEKERDRSLSLKNQTTTPRTLMTSSEKEEDVASSALQTSTCSTRSLDKIEEADRSLSLKNQTTTPRTLVAPFDKEKTVAVSSLSKNQIATAIKTKAALDKAKEKVQSSWSNNKTETSMMGTPSGTSLYNANEKDRSSSSKYPASTSNEKYRGSLPKKEKERSSSSKYPTCTSNEKERMLARTSTQSMTAKEKILNSWYCNETETSTMETPSRTSSLYNANERDRNSSSKYLTSTLNGKDRTSSSKYPTHTSLYRTKEKERGTSNEKDRSSSSKYPTPSTFDKAKEGIIRSYYSSNTENTLPKSGRP